MNAGQLRHSIVIQKRSTAPDAYGGETVTWVDFLTCKAEVRPLSGRELMTAQQTASEVTHKVILRYAPGISSALRVKFGSRIFEVKSVINYEERNRELQLLCTEGLTNG